MIIAGNWKMNKTPHEAQNFLRSLKGALQNPSENSALGQKHTLLVFAPALVSESVARETENSPILWGGQNCYFEQKGAFTGESSPATLKAMGAHSVLVGHSERRQIFDENDALLAKKMRVAQECGLVPMLCVGETLTDRDQNKTHQVLEQQLTQDLELADTTKAFYIAYEPVWAIGTGRVASLEQVQDAHGFIRSFLSKKLGAQVAAMIPLLYGGSVNEKNAAGLAQVPNVNGFLIGGASLESTTFLSIATSV